MQTGMVVQACKPSTQAKARRIEFEASLGYKKAGMG